MGVSCPGFVSSAKGPSELQLLGHFCGDVSKGQLCPPQSFEAYTTAGGEPAGKLAYLCFKSHTGPRDPMCAGQEEGPCYVHLTATTLSCLPQGQHHLRRVSRTPYPYIPATSGGPGLARFLMPRYMATCDRRSGDSLRFVCDPAAQFGGEFAEQVGGASGAGMAG